MYNPLNFLYIVTETELNIFTARCRIGNTKILLCIDAFFVFLVSRLFLVVSPCNSHKAYGTIIKYTLCNPSNAQISSLYSIVNFCFLTRRHIQFDSLFILIAIGNRTNVL